MTRGMKRAEPLFADVLPSPFGPLLAVADAAGALVQLDFLGSTPPEERLGTCGLARGSEVSWNVEVLAPVAGQLAAWLARERRDFDLALAPRGTDFQRRVWDELRRIPYGTTISYGELARRLGSPAAVRAVGRANGANPIAIVVPCHRVIGADGSLTGYAGGLERKRELLAFEGALLALES